MAVDEAGSDYRACAVESERSGSSVTSVVVACNAATATSWTCFRFEFVALRTRLRHGCEFIGGNTRRRFRKTPSWDPVVEEPLQITFWGLRSSCGESAEEVSPSAISQIDSDSCRPLWLAELQTDAFENYNRWVRGSGCAKHEGPPTEPLLPTHWVSLSPEFKQSGLPIGLRHTRRHDRQVPAPLVPNVTRADINGPRGIHRFSPGRRRSGRPLEGQGQVEAQGSLGIVTRLTGTVREAKTTSASQGVTER